MSLKSLFQNIAITLAGVFLLSGCVTADPRLAEALRGTRVAEIKVEATPDVATGLPMINGKTPDEQVAYVVTALRQVADRDLKGLPGGPRASRMIITLQRADLASEQGRVLTGSSSYITGTVRLEDVKTGQLIAQNAAIRGENHGMKGQGAGGMAIAFAYNALTTKNQASLAEKLAADFTKNIKAWLVRK